MPSGLVPDFADATVAILAYVTCSSLALVANKVVMSYLAVPGLVFCLQLTCTIAFIHAASAFGRIEIDSITWHNTKIFTPYMCSFVLSLYSNGRALAASNIETVIVFRACSPLFVSVLDWWFLGRHLPDLRSFLALVGVVAGAVGYVMADGEFAMNGIAAYKWVTLNLAGIVFEMTYGKFIVSGFTFRNPVWGATFYTNVLALGPMLLIAVSTGEAQRLSGAMFDSKATSGDQFFGMCWLTVSCIIGVGISWAGWNARSKCSATVYTLLGVVCKFVSVILNVLLWDKHASPLGLTALSICLVSSSSYRQAPERKPHEPQAITQMAAVPQAEQIPNNEDDP